MKNRIIAIGLVLFIPLLIGMFFLVPAVIRTQSAVNALRAEGAVLQFASGTAESEEEAGMLQSIAPQVVPGNVQSVALSRFSNQTSRHLQLLTGLRHISLLDLNDPNYALAHLASIDSLQGLTLAQTYRASARLELEWLNRCPKLASLTLAGSRFSDDDLLGLRNWPALRHVHIEGGWITSSGLSTLASVSTIRELELDNAVNVADDGIRSLERLKDLESLHLTHTTITDEGMKACAAWKSLRSLKVDSPAISHAGVQQLEGLQWLEHLTLQDADLQESSINLLASLPALRKLDLSGASITNATVHRLSRLSSLTDLSLHRNQLSDEAVTPLSQLKKLRKLTVGPFMTEDAVYRLHYQLPGCRIRLIDENGVCVFQMPSAIDPSIKRQ